MATLAQTCKCFVLMHITSYLIHYRMQLLHLPFSRMKFPWNEIVDHLIPIEKMPQSFHQNHSALK